MKKLLAAVLSAALLCGGVSAAGTPDGAGGSAGPLPGAPREAKERAADYDTYTQTYSSMQNGQDTVVLRPDTAALTGAAEKAGSFEGKEGVLKLSTSETETAVTWHFQMPRSGCYRIRVTYYALENRSSDILFGLKLNGAYPFFGCDQLSLSKVWRNDTADFKTDKRGNESRPGQVQVMTWQTAYLTDDQGLANDPYMFAFFEGAQSLTITGEMTDVVIERVELCPAEALPFYADVACTLDLNQVPDAAPLLLEAEKPAFLSHSSIIPMTDRTSAATSPSHPTQIRYNTIGSYNWQSQGQWITWEFEIEKAGVYNIGMRVRQNFQRGYDTTRRVYIDGKVPFSELNQVEFPYTAAGIQKTLGDGEPLRVLFHRGHPHPLHGGRPRPHQRHLPRPEGQRVQAGRHLPRHPHGDRHDAGRLPGLLPGEGNPHAGGGSEGGAGPAVRRVPAAPEQLWRAGRRHRHHRAPGGAAGQLPGGFRDHPRPPPVL